MIEPVFQKESSSVTQYHSPPLLEMIRGRPSTLGGGENKVLADRLMGSVNRTLLRVKTRERFKVKMRVVLRAVSLVLFTV